MSYFATISNNFPVNVTSIESLGITESSILPLREIDQRLPQSSLTVLIAMKCVERVYLMMKCFVIEVFDETKKPEFSWKLMERWNKEECGIGNKGNMWKFVK
ncbi:TPA: hypothetical protein JD344_07790 [Serratia marcescens]|nr:hypothetical protein AM681_16090 [Serratia marcescens]OFS86550.1 hypothetical protein HMPREF3138_21555 [Serratia sp. HMSC15F11]AVU41147.1 hypothetical protein AS658_15940 [Serratia marcescens]HAU5644388.1 hypothetical protein [Serratia marcescens]HAU5718494.1 hypothetical protein [Serratia marcescens]